MPTEERFREAYEALMNARDTGERTSTLNTYFPNHEDLHAFCDYTKARYDELCPPTLSRNEFVEKVDSQNLLQKSILHEFTQSMELEIRPWIPIGFDKHHLYRLVPEPYGLQPQSVALPEDCDYATLLPECILGLNSTVQPKEPTVPTSRRQANLSEESVRTAESDDDAPGFVFFQLGELEAAPYPQKDDAEGWPCVDGVFQGDDYDWKPTGFYLVAKLNPFGSADGIYAIYNMFPEDEFTGTRDQITHDKWGLLPTVSTEVETQFSCARIGRRLGDLGENHRMVWEEQIEHPVELVCAVRNRIGAMRVTVDDSDRVK
ncbi:hypothetical protein QBC46DRAFT_355417 [Diplogelasinospora grovesii]|uniref:Uncharacterized protein n=1 Tax=Diplogelasinospora grovesii TaxID=303347 RepID=A0AAN6S3D0_9PEZI|nr:hypothetical protein QBC46DRAFT_355417 [Diplogelasinospora grovesii]